VDRLAALGNALVPQIAEWIGRRILEYERAERSRREAVS
jgi:site-specific DNA-cytosine methylase